jgi:hypothetical protein
MRSLRVRLWQQHSHKNHSQRERERGRHLNLSIWSSTSPPGDKPKKQWAAAAQPVFAVSWPLLYSSQFYLQGWLVVKKTFSSAGKDEKKIYIYKREWKWLGFFVRERWKINWGGGKDRGGSRDSPRGGRESLSKNLYLPIVPWYSFARYLSHGEW